MILRAHLDHRSSQIRINYFVLKIEFRAYISIAFNQIMIYYCVVMLELTAQISSVFKVSKGAKTRNRYNQVQLDTTNESQEVSPFPAGGHHKAQTRRAQIHSKPTYDLLFMHMLE